MQPLPDQQHYGHLASLISQGSPGSQSATSHRPGREAITTHILFLQRMHSPTQSRTMQFIPRCHKYMLRAWAFKVEGWD